MGINTSFLSDFDESADILDDGRYAIKCIDAKTIKDGKTLVLKHRVIGGRTQDNGNEPEGVEFDDFVLLSGFSEHRDGGKYAMSRLKNTLDTFGIDYTDEWNPADFLTSTEDVEAKVKRDTNQDGEPVMKVVKYFTGGTQD